ncbi:MAG: tRNA glutamyl-Q(34) synthetase GluQRS [Zetaproteobacteria bacterium]|nr:MAG: tRNA glutamyl-Q(34) synthetase GluQRS [Zetaproteobacteria bacterium]
MASVTRFAPSPTGLLHVGNGYSALCCRRWAEEQGGRLLLRIEDIDHTRCRARFVDALLEDLRWLGIAWEGDVWFQHARMDAYRSAIARLERQGLLYPCFCSRAQIAARLARSAPHGRQRWRYPGTCRRLTAAERRRRMEHEPYALRLDARAAAALLTEPVVWREVDGGRHTVDVAALDDEVLMRRDIGVSYHLAVVVDDAAQGVDTVIRGADLRAAAPLHAVLQRLLDLPAPGYLHHRLVRDRQGRRLAKRDGATTLRALAGRGVSAEALRSFLFAAEREGDPVWPPEPPLLPAAGWSGGGAVGEVQRR